MTTSAQRHAAIPTRIGTDAPIFGLLPWATTTTLLALFFPKIEGIRGHGRSAWGLLYFWLPLDLEGLILIPLIVAITFALFWFVGGWALRDAHGRNRPARVGLVTALLALAGSVAFWLSTPIILGDLALMLGLAGRQLSGHEGRAAEATTAAVLGLVAAIIGAAIWSFVA